MTSHSTAAPRTLLVVWGGVDAISLARHIDAGRMPNLQALVERGSTASLLAAEPVTPQALLTSLATGCAADRHGVLAPAQRRADQGGVEPTGHRSWRAPSFWQALEAHGLRTATIGWPATAPATAWPGLHVDERFVAPFGSAADRWLLAPRSVSPPRLADALEPLRVHPGDDLFEPIRALVPRLPDIDQAADPRIARLGEIIARAATVQAAAMHLAEHEPWDLLCVGTDLLHAAQLGFLGAAEPYDAVVDRAHAFADMMLGALQAQAGPAATVFVVSPNGLRVMPDGRLREARRGVLVAAGPGIAADAMLPGARLIDVAPTLLARYGLALPADGTPIPGLAPATPMQPARLPPPEADTPGRSDALAADLAALGYLDQITPAQADAMRRAEALHHRLLGIARLARGAVADAAAALEAALALHPDDADALRHLGACRVIQNDHAACHQLGTRLLALDPASPWGHLGVAFGQIGANHDPAAALARAREIGANDPDVLSRIGGFELLRGDLARAAEAFAAAQAIDPAAPEAAFGTGLVLARQGDAAAAIAALRQATGLAYTMPLAHAELGRLFAATGRWRDAVTALETALAQDPALPLQPALAEARAALAQTMVAAAAPP